MGENEFSHAVKLGDIGAGALEYQISANRRECAALAARFDLLSLDRLTADIALSKSDNGVVAKGRLKAELVQACTVTDEPVADSIDEEIDLLFVPEPAEEAEIELELASDECDTMFHDGRVVDLGEAAAQTMGLALNPYPRSKAADARLQAAGVKSEEDIIAEQEAEKAKGSPFAALAGLKDKEDKR